MPRILQRYRKSLAHSYAFGVYPTLELLSAHPEYAAEVLLQRPGRGGEGILKVLQLCRSRGIPTSVSPAAIRRVSGRDFPVVGVFRKYQCPISPHSNHVVLHRPQYEGNVGTVIRTMVGFGARHLAIISPAPDPMSPSLIRASMGAVFRLHWGVFGDLDQYRRSFCEHHLYCFMTDGDILLDQVVLRGLFSLVFGGEDTGLPARAKELGTAVRIRHNRDIDSLNLGVAVGIALHESMQMFQPGLR